MHTMSHDSENQTGGKHFETRGSCPLATGLTTPLDISSNSTSNHNSKTLNMLILVDGSWPYVLQVTVSLAIFCWP